MEPIEITIQIETLDKDMAEKVYNNLYSMLLGAFMEIDSIDPKDWTMSMVYQNEAPDAED